MNVLVANAISVPGLAVIRSLGKRNLYVTGASNSPKHFPLFSKYCKKSIILRTNADQIEDHIQELYDIVRTNGYDAFLPVMHEVLLSSLAQRKKDFERHTRLVLPDFDQLRVLNNKATVSAILDELEIPHPKSYLVDSEYTFESIKREAYFPLILKPHRGEGAQGVITIMHPEDLVASYHEIRKEYGPALIQEFIHGVKHSAVFLLNGRSEVRRFFVHRKIREYPVTGGPACFLMSCRYEPIYEYGLRLLKRVSFSGLANMEFIIDARDGKPKIIDVNPRIYGPIQCAISAGVDLPYDMYRMALEGDIETDLSYKEGVTCRHLLFEDTKHVISVLRGTKSPEYTLGKLPTLLNSLNFCLLMKKKWAQLALLPAPPENR